MANYRDELLDISAFDRTAVETLVSEFHSAFSRKDAYMELDGSKLHIMLARLDFNRYKQFLYALSIPKQVMDAAFDAVDKIGSYGIKGGKRHFSDYNAERKVANRKKKEADRGKHYYANDNGFSATNNALPAEYENKIICADSLDILKKLPDNCIDIIFTSPPYNFGLAYDSHDDTSMWDDYFNMLFLIFKEGIRVLKYGGRFVVNVQPLYSDYIPAHHIISNFFIQQKMIWKSEIIWEKNNYNCKMCSYGSWKSPASPYMKYTWEFVEVFCKGDLKKAGSSQNADISAEEFKSWVVAKWSIAPERHMKEFGHPAMFPESLVERVLKLFSFQGDIVLDPFNGAGSTTAVAKRTGRRYLGIDISQEYCDTAQKRLDGAEGQLSFFDDINKS